MPELDLETIRKKGIPLAIKLAGKNQSAPGEVFVQRFSESMRVWRGLKTGFIFLLVTIVSAFIPIVHFILVPLFLVITIVAAVLTVGPKGLILGGQGTCPECGAVFRIFRRAERFPFSDVCEGCGRQIGIELERYPQ